MDSATIVQIVAGLLVLASFVVAYLSAKTWRWDQVILLLLVFLTTLGFVYMAARTLKTQQVWRDEARKYEAAVAKLQLGDPAHEVLGNEQLAEIYKSEAKELNRLVLDRGRVWYNCAPGKIDAATGQVSVTTELPNPNRIDEKNEKKTMLYVFESQNAQDKGRYLGQFKVAAVKDTQVDLVRAMVLNARQLQQLAASKGPWTLYEHLPLDSHELLSGLSDDEKKALFAADVINEYLKDGKPAAAGDPAEAVWIRVKFLKPHGATGEEGKFAYNPDDTGLFDRQAAEALIAQKIAEEVGREYVRPLRSYSLLLEDLDRQQAERTDQIKQLTADVAAMQAADKSAAASITLREAEKTTLTAEYGHLQQEAQAVAAYKTEVEKRWQSVMAEVRDTLASNKQMAAELTRWQLKASEEINRRAAAVVQGARRPAKGINRAPRRETPHPCVCSHSPIIHGRPATMGIYDREYYREERTGIFVRPEWTIVTWLIVVNVAVFVIDYFFATGQGRVGTGHWLSDHLSVRADTLTRPWEWWRLLTYGFVHNPADIRHVAWNMFGLWVFGRDVEILYGRMEFLRIYLTALVVASSVWSAAALLQGVPSDVPMMGASGAVAAVLILFAVNFPQRELLLFFVLPVRAWVVAVLMVVFDLLGASNSAGTSNVAYSAHLAGAAFALVYWRSGMNLGRWLPTGDWGSILRRRPKLRVHNPEERGRDLSRRVDEILEKISRQGEESLTKDERRTLEEASRQYQRRRE